jgi:hypothetical protein
MLDVVIFFASLLLIIGFNAAILAVLSCSGTLGLVAVCRKEEEWFDLLKGVT